MTGSALQAELAAQRQAWEARPLVRALYTEWFERMATLAADVEGPSIEIGAGIGTLSEALAGVEPTDVEPTPWADAVVDAQDLPYADRSVANLYGVDVLHHLPRPGRFLADASRVLVPGGRILLLEPYGSPLATLSWRFLHHEDYDATVDPFADLPQSSEAPLASNIALPTLLFFRHDERFAEHFPQLRIAHQERLALLAYPLSGGFGRRPLIGPSAGMRLARAERRLAVLGRLMAFRCLMALERSH